MYTLPFFFIDEIEMCIEFLALKGVVSLNLSVRKRQTIDFV